MEIGIKYGLECSHFSGFEILEVMSFAHLETENQPFLTDELYCDRCGKMQRINRINIFLKQDYPVKKELV